MWSGQFVHLTQSWNNYKCLDANATTWMDYLEANGYLTKMMGKLDYTSGSHSVRYADSHTKELSVTYCMSNKH